MRNAAKLGILLVLLAAMTACQTTPAAHYLDADARPHIQNVDSLLIAKQTEMGADIKTSKISQYLQGHIIPVLFDIGVNTVRSKNAKKHVTPIRETLGDYDYAMDIKEEFNRALEGSTLKGAGDLHILREEPMGFRAAFIRHSKADAVMFIDVKYAFTPSFETLNLSSAVLVYPINPELSPYKEKPDTDNVIEYSDNIYRNQFTASIPVSHAEDLVSGETRKTSENAAAWAALSSEQLTEKLQKAAAKLANQIAIDLNADEVEIEIEGSSAEDDLLTTEPILIETDFGQ